MDGKEREIKKILAGKVDFEGNVIRAKEGLLLVGRQGLPNGWGAMMVAGLYHKEYWFDITENQKNGFEEAAKVLYCMGKKCKLEYFPVSEAIIRRGLTNSQVLILEKDEYQLRLSIYMPKELTAAVACMNTVKAFCKHLPAGISLIENKQD